MVCQEHFVDLICFVTPLYCMFVTSIDSSFLVSFKLGKVQDQSWSSHSLLSYVVLSTTKSISACFESSCPAKNVLTEPSVWPITSGCFSLESRFTNMPLICLTAIQCFLLMGMVTTPHDIHESTLRIKPYT